MLKKVLGVILGLLLASCAFAQVGASPGKAELPWSASSLASALGVSQSYSLSIGNQGVPYITWQTTFSSAPSSITITLEGSVDCSSYSTIDTSTSTAGEIRSIGGSYKCLRFNNSAVSGGSGKTITLAFVYSRAGSITVGSGTGGPADPADFSSPAGTLAIGGVAGAVTLDADLSIVPLYSTGASDPATCTAGGMFHLRTDLGLIKFCPVTDTWSILASGAPTDDNILQGSGTAWALEAIPDCDDSVGQHLNYDTTTNAWSCGTSSGSASFDPGTSWEYYDEFLSGANATGTSGQQGSVAIALGTGTITPGTSSSGLPTTAHYGYLSINSHATNDNSGAIITINNSGGTGAINNWTVGNWAFDVLFQFPVVATTALYVGLVDVYNADPTAGANFIGLRRDTDLSDTAIVGQICNAAGAAGCAAAGDDTNSKVAATSVTPADNSWHRFRMSQLQAGVGGARTIYMQMDDATAVTFCASGCSDTLGTEPAATTNSLFFGLAFVTRAASNSISAKLDYWRLTATGLTRY